MTDSIERSRWRAAWERALYADDGFFSLNSPGDHFRTAANSSPLFAGAVLQLVEDHGFTTVVDMGAGAGELLNWLHDLSGGALELIGVDVRQHPHTLHPSIEWRHHLPEVIEGLLFANEWLDNIPCDVVECAPDGVVRHVEVDGAGNEALGAECASDWLERWWPLPQPGARAEIGLPRDTAWTEAVERVSGLAIAVDYGHVLGARPEFGSLRSYRNGHETPVNLDGRHDVTAAVAIDAVAGRAGGSLERQRDVLDRLGVSGARPDLQLATDDPMAYLQALSEAGEAAELRAAGGWGDFWWLITECPPRVGD